MKWDEFCDLLSGLSPESPLGRIAQIRLENDKDILKHFTSAQHKIRSEWRSKRAKAMTSDELNSALEMFKQAFVDMA